MRYFLTLGLLMLSGLCAAQDKPDDAAPSAPSTFVDSVSLVISKSGGETAVQLASALSRTWGQLAADAQAMVRQHYRQMKARKYATKPHIILYFSALSAAVEIEKADASRLREYLTVAGQVIESYDPKKAAKFFSSSRTFFSHHALHAEKSFRLRAVDDTYHFDFIAPVVAAESMWDTPASETVEEQPAGEDAWEDTGGDLWSDDPVADDVPADDMPAETFLSEVPGWMTPEPPPYQEGPVIRFDRITLNFVTSYDSIFVTNSKGTYSLLDNIFVGENGRIDWSTAGLPADQVYADLTAYHFPVTAPRFKAGLANLTYTGKTPGPVPGILEYKSQARPDSAYASYPRFTSYQSNLNIQGLGDESIRYVGGFSLSGNRISGESVSGDLSTVEVTVDGTKKFSARSKAFSFQDSSLTSRNARLRIYQRNDSIVHPQVRLKYDFAKKHLLVMHDDGVMHYAPYASPFFNVDFSADIMRWDMRSDSIDVYIDGGRNIVPMVIESVDFYSPDDFRLLQGTGFSFHPLALVVGYCFKQRVREFYSSDLATYARKDIGEVQKAIEFLHQKGMVEHDAATDRVKVREKAVELYRSFKGESDYDNLKIHSVIDSLPNATINLPGGYMTVRGVEEFKISDSLNVRIKPDSSIITILQNRDIKFDGTVNAGNYEITGKGFTLKYDSFFIKLTHVDSINFYVTEKNSKGQNIRRKVNNSMVGADSTAAAEGGLGDTSRSSGTLYISRANNKSGKEKTPTFPRLDAETGGVIYFDRPEVLGGVYDRSIFFVIPPFDLDSLNDTDPSSINFDGTFITSGMFPSFKEKLHTMPDKSLGFEHHIPGAGYQLYQGEGKMLGDISLTNRGIRGNGKIEYLAARVSSPDFLFYADSVVGTGNSASITEQQFGAVTFPQASLADFEMKWFPKEDKMKLRNLKAPINMYDSSAVMNGRLVISKEGLFGEGKLDTRGTELLSKNMYFTRSGFNARNAKFKVNSNDPRKPLIYGDDIKLTFNLDENYADISPEVEGVAAINFPYAQVKTSIPNGRYDFDTKKIVMNKSPEVPLENSYFYTTRTELDSLAFNADRAEYDLTKQELKVSGIPYIIVADAKITPENNEVLILENARIGTLKNTTIILDTLNGYHRLTEGVVDIVSRKEFTGYATYQYVNFLSDTFAIKMTDFHLEPVEELVASRKPKKNYSLASMQTVARGSVDETQNLVLGAGMFYKGEMTMYATRPALELDGYVKLDIKNIDSYNGWIAYSQTGDETDVFVDFDNAVDDSGKKLQAGLYYSLDNDLYMTFLNEKKNEDDEALFTPGGTLYYDNESKEYKIEDKEKAAGNKLEGKVFSYNDESRQIRFEGPVSLLPGNKDFSLTTSVIGSGNLASNEIRMNSFIIMDSNVPSQAFEIMARNIKEVIETGGADEGLGDQTELLYKISNIVGERVAKDYDEKSLQGYVPLTSISQLARPLVLSNVNLKWSEKHKAFYSEGNIGVSNILANDINGGFEGFLEVRKSEDGGNIFNVFIKASGDAWYYFGFEGSRLLVHSSNNEFNDVVSKRTNAGKAKLGEIAFVPGSDEETVAFINQFRKKYYGIESPYSLNSGTIAKPTEAPTIETITPAAKPVEEEEDDGF